MECVPQACLCRTLTLNPHFHAHFQFSFGIVAGMINFTFCMENKFLADARSNGKDAIPLHTAPMPNPAPFQG